MSLSSTLIRNLIHPLYNARSHPTAGRYRREFERTQYLTAAELEAMQLELARKLLRHAHQACPFYRERMDAAGVRPEIASLTELAKLPPLTKRNIQDHGPAMMAEGFPESARMKNQTGGSTGSPLQFLVDKERIDSRMASTERHNLWAGLRPGDWYALLWGARLDQLSTVSLRDRLRNDWLYRRVELNTSLITPEKLDSFVTMLRHRRPRFLIAYAHSGALFAEHVREKGIRDIRFEAMITTAEVLLPETRRLLEETFGGKVFNRYGCREVSIIASECEQHGGMHVNSECLLVEIDRDPSLPDGLGKILVTDLRNFSMPLIRYEIGDVGAWATTPCACGRGLPMLSEVRGRTTDFIVLEDGSKISGPSLTLVVADMPDVRQVQFVQHSPRAITLRVVPGKGYGEQTRQELRKRLDLYLRGRASLEIREAEPIASEASGKYRFVIGAAEAAEAAPAANATGENSRS